MSAAVAVYDTMVFLQAAVRPDRVHRTMQAVDDGSIALCLSPELLDEIRNVLTRAKLRKRFPALTPEVAAAFIKNKLSRAIMFQDVPSVFTWPQHPDDDHLFNLAIKAQAKYLATWETRILKLNGDTTPAAIELRSLAPQLSIVTPAGLAQKIADDTL